MGQPWVKGDHTSKIQEGPSVHDDGEGSIWGDLGLGVIVDLRFRKVF